MHCSYPKTVFQEIKTILAKYQQETLSSLFNLAYLRVEMTADARHRACRCGISPQMSFNKADAARSARL